MTTPWDGIENTFDINKEIIVFNNKKELKEKIDFYLKNDELRETIRLNGYKKSKLFTPKKWGEKLIKIIENE